MELNFFWVQSSKDLNSFETQGVPFIILKVHGLLELNKRLLFSILDLLKSS